MGVEFGGAHSEGLEVKRDTDDERKIIIKRSDKRPYGAKLAFSTKHVTDLGINEGVCIGFESGAYVTILTEGKQSWEGGEKFTAQLEGFPTATSAEQSARRLVQALLWNAVSTAKSLSLHYTTYEPSKIYDRTASGRFVGNAFAFGSFEPTKMMGEIYDAYNTLPAPDETLLLSMEIFCSAGLESSQRATFLLLVSALEPLAAPASLRMV